MEDHATNADLANDTNDDIDDDNDDDKNNDAVSIGVDTQTEDGIDVTGMHFIEECNNIVNRVAVENRVDEIEVTGNDNTDE